MEAARMLEAEEAGEEEEEYTPLILGRSPNIKEQVAGMGLLKKMVIIGAIFRLAVPLAATPLASYLEELRVKKMEKQQAA